jgi:hypothetical protein
MIFGRNQLEGKMECGGELKMPIPKYATVRITIAD